MRALGNALDRVSRRRGEIAVSNVRGKSGPTQPFRHLDCRGDRAVPPTSAAERDGHVTFARGPVAGNPVVEKRFDAVQRLPPSGFPLPDRRERPGPHLLAVSARRPSAGSAGSAGRTPDRRFGIRRGRSAKEVMVSTGGRLPPNRRRSSSRSSAGVEVGGVEDAVGRVAQRHRAVGARGRCRLGRPVGARGWRRRVSS